MKRLSTLLICAVFAGFGHAQDSGHEIGFSGGMWQIRGKSDVTGEKYTQFQLAEGTVFWRISKLKFFHFQTALDYSYCKNSKIDLDYSHYGYTIPQQTISTLHFADLSETVHLAFLNTSKLRASVFGGIGLGTILSGKQKYRQFNNAKLETVTFSRDMNYDRVFTQFYRGGLQVDYRFAEKWMLFGLFQHETIYFSQPWTSGTTQSSWMFKLGLTVII